MTDAQGTLLPVDRVTLSASDVTSLLSEGAIWNLGEDHREQSYRSHVFAAIDKDWRLLKLWRVASAHQQFTLTDNDPLLGDLESSLNVLESQMHNRILESQSQSQTPGRDKEL